MLNSTEPEIYPAINVKMPTIIGILTFMSRINFMLSLVKYQTSFDSNYFDIYEELKFEPRFEKTGLRGFRPGPTQTGLYNHTRSLEA